MTASTRAEVESAWRQRLSRFAQSGQTVKTFCHQESVSTCSFYHWRQRLQRQQCHAAGALNQQPLSIWARSRQRHAHRIGHSGERSESDDPP